MMRPVGPSDCTRSLARACPSFGGGHTVFPELFANSVTTATLTLLLYPLVVRVGPADECHGEPVARMGSLNA